jgi:hypothetical protein
MKALASAMPLQPTAVAASVSGPSGQNTISMRTERNDASFSCTAALAVLFARESGSALTRDLAGEVLDDSQSG